jgi:hypothetical protein
MRSAEEDDDDACVLSNNVNQGGGQEEPATVKGGANASGRLDDKEVINAPTGTRTAAAAESTRAADGVNLIFLLMARFSAARKLVGVALKYGQTTVDFDYSFSQSNIRGFQSIVGDDDDSICLPAQRHFSRETTCQSSTIWVGTSISLTSDERMTCDLTGKVRKM